MDQTIETPRGNEPKGVPSDIIGVNQFQDMRENQLAVASGLRGASSTRPSGAVSRVETKGTRSHLGQKDNGEVLRAYESCLAYQRRSSYLRKDFASSISAPF